MELDSNLLLRIARWCRLWNASWLMPGTLEPAASFRRNIGKGNLS